jgi:hypothetical protein
MIDSTAVVLAVFKREVPMTCRMSCALLIVVFAGLGSADMAN